MTSQEDRIGALEARLQKVEDMLAIYQLLSAYGPAVDRGDAEATAALWVEDGSYDWGGAIEEGCAGLKAMVKGERHQGIIAGGAGHVLSPPHITISGDRATALCYSRLYRREGESYVLARLSANRWELMRTGLGWRVKSRINRLLDGSPGARALLEPPAAG